MQIELGLLDILFRISIFCLLAYKLFDLARRYAYPMFIQQIIRERNQHRELLEKENLLISTRHRFETQISNQRKMFTLIERNVQNWHNLMQDELVIQEHNHIKLAQEIGQKRQIQQVNLTLQKDVEAVVPKAVSRAHQVLVAQYGGKDGEALMCRMIDKLVNDRDAAVRNG